MMPGMMGGAPGMQGDMGGQPFQNPLATGIPGMEAGPGSVGVVAPQRVAGGTRGGWNPTGEGQKEQIQDIKMAMSYGEKRTLQSIFGVVILVLFSSAFIYWKFIWVPDEKPTEYCPTKGCLHAYRCVEIAAEGGKDGDANGDMVLGSAECLCSPGYYGELCESARIAVQAFADGALADCDVWMDTGPDFEPSEPSTNSSTVYAVGQTGFDGKFTFLIDNIDAFIGNVQYLKFIVVPGDSCRSIATEGYLPSPLVLRVPPRLLSIVGNTLGITPLSTVEWVLARHVTASQFETSTEQLDAAALLLRDNLQWDSDGVHAGDPYYRIGEDSVNHLVADCVGDCLVAFCTAVQMQNVVAMLAPLLEHMVAVNNATAANEAWISTYYALAMEVRWSSVEATFDLSDPDCCNRVLVRAANWMHSGTELPQFAVFVLDVSMGADVQALQSLTLDIVVAANLLINEFHSAGLADEHSDCPGGVCIDLVSNGVQSITAVVGPTAPSGLVGPSDGSSGSVYGIVRHVWNQTGVHASGGQINLTLLFDYAVGDALELAVQAVDLPSRTVHTIQGSILADGYYTHCRVYIDKNQNGQFDTVEPFDLSDEQGWYKVEAALPGDPVENLLEPSDVVRVSPDFPGSSDNCRSTLGGSGGDPWRPHHVLSGVAGGAALTPLSSIVFSADISGGFFNYQSSGDYGDLVNRCVRSKDTSCVEKLVLASQIQITSWVSAVLVSGDSETSAASYQTWEAFRIALATTLSNSGGVFATAAMQDVEQIEAVLGATLAARCASGSYLAQPGCPTAGSSLVQEVSVVTAWLNADAATAGRLVGVPIVCEPCRTSIITWEANCRGNTSCFDFEQVQSAAHWKNSKQGGVDGGAAAMVLMRRLNLVRTRTAPLIAQARVGFLEVPAMKQQVMDAAVTEQLASEFDLDECISQPCLNGGVCEDRTGVGGAYFCVCDGTDYRGDICGIEILTDHLWATNWLMESSLFVGVSIVIIPVLAAAFQFYKYGKLKAAELGNSVWNGMRADGTPELSWEEQQEILGVTTLLGILDQENDISGHWPPPGLSEDDPPTRPTTQSMRSRQFSNPARKKMKVTSAAQGSVGQTSQFET